MYKTLLTAASTGLQNQAMFSALSNSADQSFRLGSWSENVSISDSETLSVGINLEFDILLEASFPIEWDEEASEFAFIQHTSSFPLVVRNSSTSPPNGSPSTSGSLPMMIKL